MATRTAFVGEYWEHETQIKVRIRRTTTSGKVYTHAVIPYYTTKTVFVPSQTYPGRTYSERVPCEPQYGKAQFCGSLALAQKKLKPGWILTEVHEEIR